MRSFLNMAIKFLFNCFGHRLHSPKRQMSISAKLIKLFFNKVLGKQDEALQIFFTFPFQNLVVLRGEGTRIFVRIFRISFTCNRQEGPFNLNTYKVKGRQTGQQ